MHNHQELLKATAELFEHSVLLLAQEYLYTEYDWRIGVLNRKPIFACQYFMSKGHWQIFNHKAQGADVIGECRTLAIEDAPASVVDLAVKTASLIGDGLYGVDLKPAGDNVMVIEVMTIPTWMRTSKMRTSRMAFTPWRWKNSYAAWNSSATA